MNAHPNQPARLRYPLACTAVISQLIPWESGYRTTTTFFSFTFLLPFDKYFNHHRHQHLEFLVKPQHWPAFARIFGFSLPVVLVCHRWLQPNYLRRELMVVALWFVLMLFVGVLIEIRIFGELISYMSVALGVILYRRLLLRNDAAIAA